jgi:hypothetical protein
MSNFVQQIFEDLFSNDLFIGRIEIPRISFNEKINQLNLKILNFQQERYQLFNLCFNDDRIISLLEKWQSDIKHIALNSTPKRKGNLWKSSWISNIEIGINNYLCSGIWFLEFQKIISEHYFSAQRIVAYFLIREVIKNTFKGNFYENRITHENTNSTLIPKNIITLDPVESQKFSYISGWVLFKLLKRDHIMNSHQKFSIMRNLLEALCTEKVEYTQETQSQTTHIVPGSKFLEFMYHLESLVIELFDKHNELGPNILRYIKNNLISNSYLIQKFITILKTTNNNNVGLNNEEFEFIYKRGITIYMKSRQKTWRSINNYIPEKGTASLRENLKTMRSNQSSQENKKPPIMKKTNLPSGPIHALEQLRVWAQLDDAENTFSKIFSVSELTWLIWAFGVSTPYKRKKILVPIVIENLKSSRPFIEEALNRSSVFAE